MMELKVRVAFFIYRMISFCLQPLVSFYFLLCSVCRKEERKRQKERLGKSCKLRPQSPLIWFHAASIGETFALFSLINYILSLKINVLLTTGTMTSSTLAKQYFGNRLIHQYAPLDLELTMRRFIQHWKPDLVVVCESEIWPFRIQELAKRRIPQIIVNAHMSERSFKAWQKQFTFAKHIFKHIDMVIGQNERDIAHYRALGVKSVALSGNLKADVFPVVDQALFTRYRNAVKNRPVWAAVSTHEGEEKIAFEVHKILKKYLPNLLTIIVPRHPERSEDILKEYSDGSLHFVRRSSNTIPNANTDILFGDTIGEMGLFLRLAQVAFIGKSLCEYGGHNPLELAVLGTAILTGPHVSNFQDMFEQFLSRDAARVVTNSQQLADQVYKFLTNEELRQKMVERAYAVANGMTGALERTLKELEPFLQPLVIQTNLSQCQSRYVY
ncbi:lipid IV(A) 3-deoxy-D-manno-octulosonic acid transferase [Bartonella sp. F02]|uniref:lipid IV(A) 3-deoxy-D-manno-octulosonic acid transferase n=1 Tax=Bartonella sp. F02 TaxID=2967262 RepID=UPI0022A8D4E0|nr:lipid IV(A) 3-deoxy-D-manno-octulosonic acid transferase [Bartonella sp. F02]MCZ2328107.1 lipid IV(A) 3-deoxy-D-manno-octulosonic acid transferase [Bartonella sp. F02]